MLKTNYPTLKYLIIGLFLLLASDCSHKEKKATILPAPDIPEEWLRLDKENFSLRYPPHWDLQNGPEGIVFHLFSPQSSPDDTFRENVNLVIENHIAGMSLDKYVALSVKNLKNKFNISFSDTRKYAIDGQVYYQLDQQWKDGMRLTQHIYLKKNTAYILSFTFESDEKASIQSEGKKIMASFKVK